MAEFEFTSVFGVKVPLQTIEKWKADFQEAYEDIGQRPLTKLRRSSKDGKTREYEGWRTRDINATLDACSLIDGLMWIQKVELVDSLGRSYEGHTTKNGAHMAWRQKNQAAAKANSRLQAQKFRERARVEWGEYCAAYAQKFPGTQPVGFDRWCRIGRKTWLSQGVEGLQLNQVKGMMAEVSGAIEERQAYLAERAKRRELQPMKGTLCSV